MPILILFLAGFLFVGVIFLFARASYPNTSSGRRSDRIPEELELNSVRDALVEKLGWSPERAEAARTEYVRFLTLLQKRPGFMLIPWPNEQGQDDLDQFWHQHILDTAKYAADCNALFGRMIHHNPHVLRGSADETDAAEKTQRLYARTFGSGSYGRPVNAAYLTGCGACATDNSPHSTGGGHGHGHGHGHGDHGGHGHSDGGHGGDGGHSCGGHGCGHGCGGH